MSSSGVPPFSGGVVGSSAAGLPEVSFINPVTSSQRPGAAIAPRSRGTDAGEWVNVRVVVILSLACTVLSLYDLFLLAAGG
jgi:hypothetical protein